jgi:hypothetical protein
MTVEMIVGPARPATDRRSPERLAEYTADHTADHGAGRTGDHEAGACPSRRTHHIGTRAQRGRRDCGKDRRCK